MRSSPVPAGIGTSSVAAKKATSAGPRQASTTYTHSHVGRTCGGTCTSTLHHIRALVVRTLPSTAVLVLHSDIVFGRHSNCIIYTSVVHAVHKTCMPSVIFGILTFCPPLLLLPPPVHRRRVLLNKPEDPIAFLKLQIKKVSRVLHAGRTVYVY